MITKYDQDLLHAIIRKWAVEDKHFLHRDLRIRADLHTDMDDAVDMMNAIIETFGITVSPNLKWKKYFNNEGFNPLAFFDDGPMFDLTIGDLEDMIVAGCWT